MADIIERTYGRAFKAVLKTINPLKKLVIKAECRVHKFINIQSLVILKNDGYKDAWALFSKHIESLNSGVVWADQDLKSSNHFYNPDKRKGLYGSGNAFKECISYYTAALTNWHTGDVRKAMFFLGAASHIIQDLTVPQHVNVNLLKHHRKYEKWVIRTYESTDSFKCSSGGIYLNTIGAFIEENALVAINAYNKNKNIPNLEDRFYNVTDIILCQAQRSTAGFLKMFYDDVCTLKERSEECTV